MIQAINSGTTCFDIKVVPAIPAEAGLAGAREMFRRCGRIANRARAAILRACDQHERYRHPELGYTFLLAFTS